MNEIGEDYDSLLSNEFKGEIKREHLISKDINNETNKIELGYIYRHILTKDECVALIKKSESYGFLSIEPIYARVYRGNTRLIAHSVGMAKVLFNRVKDQLPQKITVDGVKWKLSGLNPRFRLCKYEKGTRFCRHYDGCYKKSENEQSFYTFMIYFNDIPSENGGSTNILAESVPRGKIIQEVNPEEGLLLCFYHETLHEGAILKKGLKYMMRTDLMYTKVTGNMNI
ncbi:2OG-Fe(II) oxygenase [Candidatus Babeliales bacterium]|nr:2OG-Fe(II) oxygenase [Candidatus Babeliales bacterium]